MPSTIEAPPSVQATWPKPNYVDPVNRGPALVYICIILSAIGTVIVSARLYSRLVILKSAGWDDLLVVFSLCASITFSALVIVGNLKYYSGYHIWDIPITVAEDHRLNAWVTEWVYLAATTSVKISILLFYRRLSIKANRKFRLAAWIGIAYNVVFFVAFGIALLLICHPTEAYWEMFSPTWVKARLESQQPFSCGDEAISSTTSGAMSVIGDAYSTILPMFLIKDLQIPMRQKIALCSIFAMGFLVVAAGIVRTYLLHVVLAVDYDFTWPLWEMWIWTAIELYLSIFAASVPALKPFFRKFFIEPINTLTGRSRLRSGYAKEGSGTDGSFASSQRPEWKWTDSKAPGATVSSYNDANELEKNGYPMSNNNHTKDSHMRSESQSSFAKIIDTHFHPRSFGMAGSSAGKNSDPTGSSMHVWRKTEVTVTEYDSSDPKDITAIPRLPEPPVKAKSPSPILVNRTFSKPSALPGPNFSRPSSSSAAATRMSALFNRDDAAQKFQRQASPTLFNHDEDLRSNQSEMQRATSAGSVRAARLRAEHGGTRSPPPRNVEVSPVLIQSINQLSLWTQQQREERISKLLPQPPSSTSPSPIPTHNPSRYVSHNRTKSDNRSLSSDDSAFEDSFDHFEHDEDRYVPRHNELNRRSSFTINDEARQIHNQMERSTLPPFPVPR